jgi:hypothetical protein
VFPSLVKNNGKPSVMLLLLKLRKDALRRPKLPTACGNLLLIRSLLPLESVFLRQVKTTSKPSVMLSKLKLRKDVLEKDRPLLLTVYGRALLLLLLANRSNATSPRPAASTSLTLKRWLTDALSILAASLNAECRLLDLLA